MARLAARTKLLFYATEKPAAELIASNIVPCGPGAILDPCCGTGEPLVILGQQLNLVTYGNELDPGRFTKAREVLDYCLNGPREYLLVEGRFNALFQNPPYDRDLTGARMEITHTRRDMDLLVPGGVGVWVIPRSTLNEQSLIDLLTMELEQIEVRRFPDPLYDRFNRVVIFGIKRAQRLRYNIQEVRALEKLLEADLPVLTAGEFSYCFPAGNQISRFEMIYPEMTTILTDLETQGVHQSQAWQTMFGLDKPAGTDQYQPLLPLGVGHLAFVLAAGFVDGIKVEIDGESYLLKGFTEKRLMVSQDSEVDEEEERVTVTERERLVQTIVALGLVTGKVFTYNSLDHKQEFGAFLLQHQQTLNQVVRQTHRPLFDPERDMPAWREQLSQIHAPGLLPGRVEETGLLPAQQVPVAALATLLRKSSGGVLDGEPGTGKTAQGQAVMALVGRGNSKTVVVCPAQVLDKWKREAEAVLKEFGATAHIIGEKRRQADGTGKVAKVAKPVLDVLRAMQEPNPSLLIMSYETAKNGARWVHAPRSERKIVHALQEETVQEEIDRFPYVRSRRVTRTVSQLKRVLSCPDCGHILLNEQGAVMVEIDELGGRQQKCQVCGAVLWQQIPFSYGGRTAIADLLNRRFAGRYNLILDEAHKTKGGSTDAGYASMDLIAGARKTLELSGSLYSGKASTIFPTLMRLLPSFRQFYRPDETKRFVANHGLLETTTVYSRPVKNTSVYGYVRESVRIRELPGVSPGIVTLLLPHTAFLKLEDLGHDLPPYKEMRLAVKLDSRFSPGQVELNRIHEQAITLSRSGKGGLLAAWMHASLGWLDCPVADTLVARDKSGEIIDTFTIPGILGTNDELPAEPLPKDKALLDLVRSELGQGRGVGVYFAQVNRRDWMGRIHSLLNRNGIYSEILRQNTCRPSEREQWYTRFVKRCRSKGQEPVLLTNGNLIKEGLDLLELPTLVETGVDYKVTDLRQRTRRSWRITQERPVRVIFLYYQNSWQETALQLVAAKLKAALLVDGNLVEGLAAMDISNDSLIDVLMQTMLGKDSRGDFPDMGWRK